METSDRNETAIFAGGCFWCMEPVFDRQEGVISVVPGYTGGHVPDPSYEEVCEGETGHVEAIRIVFDPTLVAYSQLLEIFWHNIDPTVRNRQFCDYGSQYQSAIFYTSEEQRTIAEASKKQLEESTLQQRIQTKILPASDFYPAEEYHRQFYLKNPSRYEAYHNNCGRNQRLKELWKK